MRNVIRIVSVLVVVGLIAACAGAGAGGGSGGGGGGSGTTVTPPQNLVGTFALTNGQSAVMDLQIDGSTSSSAISPQSSIQVTGTVRYEGADYVVGGLYDDTDGSLNLVAENNTTDDPKEGWRFLFSGTYTDADGFSGTVQLLDDNGAEQATGSASAAGVTDGEMSAVRVFVGTFGGDDWGSWNGTLTSSSFYGTYWSGRYNEGGSFSLGASGTTVSVVDPSGLTASGALNAAEDSINGTWESAWEEEYDGVTYSGVDSGSWSGRLVDANNDAPAIDETLDPLYLSNLLFQTWENMVSEVEAAFDAAGNGDGLFEVGDDLTTGDNVTTSVSGVTARYTVSDSDVVYYRYQFTGSGYSDAQTGITWSGGGAHLEEITDVDGATLRIVMDFGLTAEEGASTAGANTTDSSTLTIDYEDGGTSNLQVDVEVDYENETLTGTWEFDGSDYVSDMGYLLF